MRNPAFDIMKGVGIIAMIIGHCVIPYPLYIFIFAWHMPMFFIVSGYFFRTKPIMDNFKRLMKQILVPYMVTACICVAAKLGCQTSLESHDYMTPVLSLINGAGSKDVAMFGEYTIGAIWFLLAMFWCRFIYNALSLKVTNNIVMGGGIILLLSITAVVSSRWLYLPTGLLQGVAAMLFFHVGVLVQKYDILDRQRPWWYICFALFFIASLISGRMEMSRNLYSCIPVNVLGAVAGTFFLYKISVMLVNLKIGSTLAYIGSISLLILCVHAIDGYFFSITTFLSEKNYPLYVDAAIVLMYRFAWVIVISWLCLKSNKVKKIFNIK